MSRNTNSSYILKSLPVFIVLPIVVLLMGNFPERTILKEALSLITLVAFFLIIGQFTWSRLSRNTVGTTQGLLTFHKLIGYTAILLLFFHPFLLVLPRFFESGVDPLEAFTTIITTFSSKGVLLGLSAWLLMVALGLTTLFRKILPMSYLTWRNTHLFLSILFITAASFHVTDLGRHSDKAMSLLIFILTGYCLLLTINKFIIRPITKIGTRR